MADLMSKSQRSALMSRVRQKNTEPEIVLRRALHGLGLRFRLHRRDLPGRPDIVFPKYRAIVFVHGCFWHGHDCRAGRGPSSNTDYWGAKVRGNRVRDARKEAELRALGWRVFTIWECETKTASAPRTFAELAETIRRVA